MPAPHTRHSPWSEVGNSPDGHSPHEVTPTPPSLTRPLAHPSHVYELVFRNLPGPHRGVGSGVGGEEGIGVAVGAVVGIEVVGAIVGNEVGSADMVGTDVGPIVGAAVGGSTHTWWLMGGGWRVVGTNK